MTVPPRAAIDIGTNTVLMLVGSRRSDGTVDVVRDEAIITRLGRGAAASGQLDPDAVEDTLRALRHHRAQAQADGVEDITAVATESLRMASNRDDFLERAREILGTEVRTISGEKEARLSYLSVARETPPGPLRVLDIGGGSTELVVGDGETIRSVRSHRIGSVRFTERFDSPDLVPPRVVEAMREEARRALESQPVPPHPVLHGLAGTVTTAAALLLGLEQYDRDAVDGTEHELERIVALRDLLASQTARERGQRPCLPPGRADVIVAGLTILEAALQHCGAHTLVARDRGVRYALL